MQVLQLDSSDKENSTKFVIEIDNKEVGFGYLFEKDVNPIEIYVEKEHQSNGYGKALFKTILEVAKKRNIKGMIFEVEESQFQFQNIIMQLGAKQISKKNNTIKYILQIM